MHRVGRLAPVAPGREGRNGHADHIDSLEILDQACEVAGTFKPMNDDEREELLSKSKEAAANGEYELFKTRSIFDSMAKNPKWLGEEPDRIADLMPA